MLAWIWTKGVNGGSDEMRLDSGHVLRVELRGFAAELEMAHEVN